MTITLTEKGILAIAGIAAITAIALTTCAFHDCLELSACVGIIAAMAGYVAGAKA